MICWLSSTNTNPYAVEEMRNQAGFAVRQIDWMHAKVYLAPGAAAVVGSANLSEPALSDSGTAGQYEAASLITEREEIAAVGHWFDQMWGYDARAITDVDITVAKERYDAARSARSATKFG